ncbi:hemin uptake protein HemP [Rhodovulum visakhapatnamense]|uniref:Hemin uptake protein HemP n=1 Tax=Rhodovulum visakhapatnamense TaxID=364297 RepID=A0ABS1RGE0_9RHOB|nr:hemin uptake protein HemP [Rhodovulum visakhapatnamense]MBL3578717.1 hemin uptake protein HemP [Rhodovulum visakhapatnamense]
MRCDQKRREDLGARCADRALPERGREAAFDPACGPDGGVSPSGPEARGGRGRRFGAGARAWVARDRGPDGRGPRGATVHGSSAAPVHDARLLTGGATTTAIVLDGAAYILRITRAGKLILTK